MKLSVKRNTVVEIISALFILLFLYTALSKLVEFRSFKWVLAKSPLIGKDKASVIGWILPLSELIIAIGLFIPRSRLISLYSSFILMLIFTLYLGYMILYTVDLPCNCGGVLEQMSWNQHLIFNAFFTLLAGIGIWLSKRGNRKEKHETIEEHKAVFT